MTDALLPYGWTDRWVALLASLERTDVAPGRVVRHDGVAVLVAGADGSIGPLPVLASVDPAPVVGDWVVATPEAVVDVLPRASLLRRQDPDGGEQPLVANIDAVLIVCGLDRPVKAGRIKRAIVLSWDAGATPIVVLTKTDLTTDVQAAIDDVDVTNLGVEVIAVSAATGAGIDAVRERCAGRTIVMLGESGAGKSTLTNRLMGEDVAGTADVRSSDSKGRHTTTSRQIHLLPGGGVLVDTPGIRGVGLWVDDESVSSMFGDVELLAEECHFSDCGHSNEPGCAVRNAVEAGEFPAERLEAWRMVRREAQSMERRSDPRARHAYERQFGRITKEAQKRKRPG